MIIKSEEALVAAIERLNPGVHIYAVTYGDDDDNGGYTVIEDILDDEDNEVSPTDLTLPAGFYLHKWWGKIANWRFFEPAEGAIALHFS